MLLLLLHASQKQYRTLRVTVALRLLISHPYLFFSLQKSMVSYYIQQLKQSTTYECRTRLSCDTNSYHYQPYYYECCVLVRLHVPLWFSYPPGLMIT